MGRIFLQKICNDYNECIVTLKSLINDFDDKYGHRTTNTDIIYKSMYYAELIKASSSRRLQNDPDCNRITVLANKLDKLLELIKNDPLSKKYLKPYIDVEEYESSEESMEVEISSSDSEEI